MFENHSKSLIATLTFKVKIFEVGTFAPKINVTILVIIKRENSNETFLVIFKPYTLYILKYVDKSGGTNKEQRG